MRPRYVAAAIALASSVAGMPALGDTGNCTTAEIIDLARSGHSKEKIDLICQTMTRSPNCCCAETFGASREPIRMGLLDYHIKNGRIYFTWSDADACGFRSNSLCVAPTYCGRG